MYRILGKAKNGQTVYIKVIDGSGLCKYVRHAFTVHGVHSVEILRGDIFNPETGESQRNRVVYKEEP